MAQFARPDSDALVGGWTSTPLWQKIDEVSPLDVDNITATGSTNCVIGLSNVSDPLSSLGHTIRARGKLSAGTTGQLKVRLVQGATPISADSTISETIDDTYYDLAYTLSSAEADSITDYSALGLEFSVSGSGGPTAVVSWAEFEVPDVPPPSGLGAFGKVRYPVPQRDFDDRLAVSYAISGLAPGQVVPPEEALMIRPKLANMRGNMGELMTGNMQ